jgi:hypothetical protein
LRAPDVNELESSLMAEMPAIVERALASESGNQFRCV